MDQVVRLDGEILARVEHSGKRTRHERVANVHGHILSKTEDANPRVTHVANDVNVHDFLLSRRIDRVVHCVKRRVRLRVAINHLDEQDQIMAPVEVTDG